MIRHVSSYARRDGNGGRTCAAILAAVLLVPLGSVRNSAHACLWDYDTLKMELSSFPTAVDLITGKFRRHSDDYYRWRIEDRTKRLPADLTGLTVSDLPLLDDIAVAHDKLAEHDRAIALMETSLTVDPDRYETHANLGTFHVHSGDFETGLTHLRRAIEINPDAHFGREIVQIRLIEFLQRERAAGRERLPLTKPETFRVDPDGFEAFRETLDPPLERTKAIAGLLGMMRFGKHDHPILLDVVGEVLHAEGHKRMAARAYLKASYGAKSEELRQEYRKRAKAALDTQTPTRREHRNLPLEDLEKTFATELAAAEKYFAEIVANEKKWIAAGLDVDAKYAETYFRDPTPAPAGEIGEPTDTAKSAGEPTRGAKGPAKGSDAPVEGEETWEGKEPPVGSGSPFSSVALLIGGLVALAGILVRI